MPRYPGAQRPAGFAPTTHYTPGHQGRVAVCLHICEGPFESSITHLRNEGLSAHFVISEAGTIAQLVDTDHSAWANGLSFEDGRWISPRNKIVFPTWQRITPGVNPNLQTISIEHAGIHTRPRPRAQLAATVAVLRWLGVQYPSLLPYVPAASLIRHGMLDTIDRINCPGPHFDLAAIAAEANAPAESWQRAWARKGVALEHVDWAIPQLYKYHYLTLGACVESERYTPGGQLSIAFFERGFIYYLAATQRAYLGPGLPPGVTL